MNLTNLWLDMFGTRLFLGIDMDFWFGMAVVSLIVIAMNVVFWSVKPKTTNN